MSVKTQFITFYGVISLLQLHAGASSPQCQLNRVQCQEVSRNPNQLESFRKNCYDLYLMDHGGREIYSCKETCQDPDLIHRCNTRCRQACPITEATTRGQPATVPPVARASSVQCQLNRVQCQEVSRDPNQLESFRKNCYDLYSMDDGGREIYSCKETCQIPDLIHRCNTRCRGACPTAGATIRSQSTTTQTKTEFISQSTATPTTSRSTIGKSVATSAMNDVSKYQSVTTTTTIPVTKYSKTPLGVLSTVSGKSDSKKVDDVLPPPAATADKLKGGATSIFKGKYTSYNVIGAFVVTLTLTKV